MSRSLPTRRMLIGAACVVVATIAFGCAEPSEPPTPLPPSGTHPDTVRGPGSGMQFFAGPAFIWAMVIADSGACIPEGTIYVVSGPGAGVTFVQDSDCDAWGYSGGVMFTGLPVGATMTLRASAPGYSSIEKTAIAATSGQAVEFELAKITTSLSR